MVYLPLWAHLQVLSSLFTAPHYFAFIFCPPNILSSFSSWGLFLCWNVFPWSSFSSFGLSSGMTSLERPPLTTQCTEASPQFCLSHYFICVFPIVLVTAWNCFICLQAISRIWPLLAPPLLPPWAEPPVTRMALVASALLSSFHPYSPRNSVFSKHQPEEKRSQSMWVSITLRVKPKVFANGLQDPHDLAPCDLWLYHLMSSLSLTLIPVIGLLAIPWSSHTRSCHS